MKHHQNPYKVQTAVPGEVYGLSVGSGVQLRGVPIGKVTQIAFAWSKYPKTKTKFIVVEFEVEGSLLPQPPDVTMKEAVKQATERGLRAIIKSQGITGTSILALEPLDPKAFPPPPIDYEPRHLYVPSAPAQLTRLVDSLDKSLKHLQELDFASIGQSVTNTLSAARDLLVKLDKLDLAKLTTNADDLLVELKQTGAKLTTAIETVQKTVSNSKLDAVGRKADSLLTELHGTNVKLQAVLDHLGTVPIQQTIANLQEVFQTLDNVLAQLKDYPSGFLFGKPPRPVEGLQPTP
jgi:paraquat-inducible protein B